MHLLKVEDFSFSSVATFVEKVHLERKLVKTAKTSIHHCTLHQSGNRAEQLVCHFRDSI